MSDGTTRAALERIAAGKDMKSLWTAREAHAIARDALLAASAGAPPTEPMTGEAHLQAATEAYDRCMAATGDHKEAVRCAITLATLPAPSRPSREAVVRTEEEPHRGLVAELRQAAMTVTSRVYTPLLNRAADALSGLDAPAKTAALMRLVYEITSLSSQEDDESHICKISAQALIAARLALGGTPHSAARVSSALPKQDPDVIAAAGRIFDIFGNSGAWRKRADLSDIYESADWQQALRYARAALRPGPHPQETHDARPR